MSGRGRRRRCRPCSMPRKVPAPKDWRASLLALIGCPDLAQQAWIWQQYDHLSHGQHGDPSAAATPPWCASMAGTRRSP